jgi:hypothetical protein
MVRGSGEHFMNAASCGTAIEPSGPRSGRSLTEAKVVTRGSSAMLLDNEMPRVAHDVNDGQACLPTVDAGKPLRQ